MTLSWSSLTRGSPSGHLSSSRSESSGSRSPWLGRAGVREAVADPWNGQDVVRPRRLGFDLAPQVADVYVDHPRLDRVLVTPDRIQDLLAAQHLPGVAGEKGQEVELGVCQLHLVARFVGSAFVDVDDRVAELEPGSHRLGRLEPAAPEVRGDAGYELAVAKRLADVVVRSDLERDDD